MLPDSPRRAVLAGCVALLAPFAAVAQEAPVAPAAPHDEIGALPSDFTEIVARVSPAVVAIATRQLVTAELPQGLPEGLLDPFLGEDGEVPPREAEAMGSGFLVSAQGHIVTNSHVIEEATDIQVQLADGTSLPAELVGTDPPSDIAVLKVEVPPTLVGDLVVAEWGDSDALEPGAWTIAVGSPFGLGNTVTVGVLSARSRDIRAGPYDDFLQTDAAINIGNSGGPLFNVDGEVVGVNTAIFSPVGASVGVGFAVPSRSASRLVGELIETGEVSRGFLGVGVQDMTDVMARAFRLPPATEGALVGSVEPGSPAEAAGLQAADIVTAVGDDAIETARDLTFRAAELQPGEAVTLTILRDGEAQEVELEVARREVPRPERTVDIDEPDRTRLGLSLRAAPAEVREELGIGDGVIVERAAPGGLGAGVGLRSGDVIVEVGRDAAASPSDVADAWAAAREEGRPLLMRVMRGPTSRYVAIES